MGHHYAEIAEEIGEPMLRYADDHVHARFMAGAEVLAEAPDEDAPLMFARWVKGAVERLDTLVDPATAARIMQQHGRVCAGMHSDHADEVLHRRRQCESLHAYIEAETGLTREGDIVYSDYGLVPEPGGMRCYCSFWHPLPADEHISLTWCNCAAGHAAVVWEALVGEPVRVEVLESCMSGGKACRFAIYLPDGWRESERYASMGESEHDA
jgi:hypothetical protein